MRNILITGSTGLLGWNVVKLLLRNQKNRVYLLVRSKNGDTATKRIDKLLKKDSNSINSAKKRVRVIEGDIAKPNLNIRQEIKKEIVSNVDTIYHCAALCEFGVPLKPIRRVNVEGTKNILDFALECKKRGDFGSFNHISTVGVIGKSGGILYEDILDIGQEFNNTYEQTKFEAEKLVEQYRQKGLSISVFRPTIITGDSRSGETSNFQMLYQPLHIFSLELFDELPANKAIKYNLVPVDYVARAILLISSNEKNNKTYQLSNQTSITLEYFLDIASWYFGFKKPKIVKKSEFDYKRLTGSRKRLLDPYLPYLNYKKIIFDTTNFKEAVNGKKFEWPQIDEKFLLTLFRYCAKMGYINRKNDRKRDEFLIPH